jgi:taurine dioxygenase
MRSLPFAVHPVAGSLGAEIEGIDLSQPLSETLFQQIETTLAEHLVLFFRDQNLEPEEQIAFTRHFGPPSPTPFIKTMAGYPEVIEVVKEADEKSAFVFGGGWHSDFSFLERPPYVTCSYAKEVPAYGGDTLFANMILAYERLSDDLKDRIDGLVALHSGERAYSPKMQPLQDLLENMQVENTNEALVPQDHPLVRTHPKTGKRGLYINPVYTIGIKDMEHEAAIQLLDELNRHALSELFTCRFRWRKGSLAIWDNRFTQHYALGDYAGKRRHMYRTTSMGERPT